MGHKWADIQNYTLPQIRDFSKGAVRYYERSAATQLQLTLVGSRGDEKAVDQMLNRLLRG